VGQAERARIEFINELWINELIEQEEGGFRPASVRRAEEAEKHGDFLLAEVLRRSQARLFRLAAIPYHQRAAATSEKEGRRSKAMLHRRAVKDYERKAAEADMLAKGDKIIARIPGFGGKSRWTGIELGHVTSIAIRDAFHRRVISYKGERQMSVTFEQVATMLKQQGLTHAEESVRFTAVTVLNNLGEKEALLTALDDTSATVRLAAAKALVSMRWTEGWTACANHRDPKVRALVEPLLKPAGEDVLLRTYVITELIRGLSSSSEGTRSFCQNALEGITGQKLTGSAAWATWWKRLGDARPGLTRTGPGVPPEIDETVDFGAWWQSGLASIQHLSNPLLKYQFPATIEWRGYLVVTERGEYRFYMRNRGESMRSSRRVHTPGRYSFPAYFPPHLVKLEIDGETVLPGEGADVVEDPSAWMRLDFTKPIRLKEGLHRIRLEFNVKSYDDAASLSNTGMWGGHPCVRLYWSSNHFLRELVSSEHLITKD